MIPISCPDLSNNEWKYLKDCIDTNWVSSQGKYIKEFEKSFSEYIGVKHSLTCSNGTTTLHLALLAIGAKAGDEIIVPSFTFIATINAIYFCNAKPVFVDINSKIWCLNPNEIQDKITSKTKAIIPVHIYGNPANMDEIGKIANKNKLMIIEDCAEALGAKFNNKLLGSFGDVSIFSFYGNKILTTGEGGMLCTNSESVKTPFTKGPWYDKG